MAIKDNETGADFWLFNCPVHGWEINAFCWRSNQEEFKDRWFLGKYLIIEPSQKQRDAFFELLKEMESDSLYLQGVEDGN